MHILFIGYLNKISNTSSLRCSAMKRIADVVDVVNLENEKLTVFYRVVNYFFNRGFPIYLPDDGKFNREIKGLVDENKYDIVWVDKGLVVRASTLRYIKCRLPMLKIVNYSPDNQVLRHNQSQQYLDSMGIYDLHVTTKLNAVEKMKKMGARDVLFTPKSYEKSFHRPIKITQEDIEVLSADVGFVGTYEKQRFESIKYLAQNGIDVKVFGEGGWPDSSDIPNLTIVNKGLYDTNYVKALRCFKISLCFLRKLNDDQQTSRSVEIPACGGFMLAERTYEHQLLFEEDKEAVFFDSNEELLEKCRYYLNHEDERIRIVEAGRRRCVESDYSNDGMICKVLSYVEELGRIDEKNIF